MIRMATVEGLSGSLNARYIIVFPLERNSRRLGLPELHA
jgi:hypothetical protein